MAGSGSPLSFLYKRTFETFKNTESAPPKQAFAEAREKAGLDNVRIHDLRAKSLTDTKKQGNDAQKLGGHADPRMTERYIRAREIDRADPPTMPKKSG